VRFRQTTPEDFHRRMAVACDKAAEVYASELSTANDPVTRDRLGTRARQKKQQAEFHRQKATELGAS
jgi:hypothetical protein